MDSNLQRTSFYHRIAYWKARALTYGRRAVVNLQHSDLELAELTECRWLELRRYLQPLLRGNERWSLDFGSGAGRFSWRLAELTNANVLAIDPVPDLISLAPNHPQVEYRRLKSWRIPADDNRFDLIWICLVLGGIADADLGRTVAELIRVLHPGGLVFIVECTDLNVRAKHWVGRSIEDYRYSFRAVSLQHLGDYSDCGEQISILAGRHEGHVT